MAVLLNLVKSSHRTPLSSTKTGAVECYLKYTYFIYIPFCHKSSCYVQECARTRIGMANRHLTRFNRIAIQGAPQMAVDKEAISLSRVYSYYSKCNIPLFYV